MGVILLLPLLVPFKAYAASANLYLSPASGSVSKGSILTVNIRENSGSEPVNSVQANLSYPADSLDFVSIGSSSAWGVVAQNSGGGGSVNIARGALPPVSGDQLVASVRFKAKKDTGSASISFASGSEVDSSNSNSNILSGTSGGTYTMRAPAATPAEAPKDTTAPTITKVEAKEITATTAVITWTTNEPSTSEVTYGPTQGYGLAANDSNSVTDHKVTLSSPVIAPGTKYHFMVKSVDPAGNAVSSPDGTFTTVGATLEAKVVSQSNKPVKGAKVTFGDVSGTTDKNGKVTLKNLPLGKQTGTISYKNKQAPASIKLDTLDNKGKPHSATFKIDVSSDLWLRILVLILMAALAAAFLYRRRGSGSSGSGGSSSGTGKSKLTAFLAGLKSIPSRLKGLLPKKETKTSSSPASVVQPAEVVSPPSIPSTTTPDPVPGIIKPDPNKPTK